MKLQFEDDRVRIRVGAAELAELRSGGRLSGGIQWPEGEWRIDVSAGGALDVAALERSISLVLPAADLDALAVRVPSRDGLRYVIEVPSGSLDLRFEVDLHDGGRRSR